MPPTMPKNSDHLIQNFIDAAVELQRRRLWLELPGDSLFLVSIPAENTRLVVNVLGPSGQDIGLGMARGEGAFRRMWRMVKGLAGVEELADEGDLLSLTFLAWNAVPEEFRHLSVTKGVSVREDDSVPVAQVKRPYQHARPPAAADLRVLIWVVRGVLVAHDAGDLRSGSPDEERRKLLELELGGELGKPSAAARTVDWPESVDTVDMPPLSTLPADLGNLPSLEACWLVAWVYFEAEVRGDNRSVSCVFVAEQAHGLLLAHREIMGDELEPVAEALAESFRGQGYEAICGLPREVVFDNSRLQRSFAPALAGLGVAATLDQQRPGLLALRQILLETAAELLACEESGCGD